MKVILLRARATDSAIYKIAESLSENGMDVKLLVWDRQHTLKSPINSHYAFQKFNLKAPLDKWTVIFYMPIWWIYEFIYLLKNDANVIHTCDIDTQWPAIIAKFVKRCRLFYTSFDFYASTIPEKRPYFIVNTIRNVVAAIEMFGIGFADVLFLVDECRYDEVKGAKINKLVYIYNSPPDRFNLQTSKIKDAADEMVIFYAGAMHKYRGIDHMIKAIENIDNVKLVLVGPGSDVLPYMEQINRYNNKIKYIGWLPTYEDVLLKTMEADVLFRFNDPRVLKSKYESPNKLFEAMMCGKPIIVNSEIAASRIVKEENCGILVPYGDIEALENLIKMLKNDPENRKKLGDNGRNAYISKYSWKIMEQRLIDTYNNSKI
ncbi:putative glycosyltransferase [Methanocella paludicola SANAE]|uniref:Glycosyltransferase n=1 Tax=Methanocella paludicola (strain DSM 17711 / JCM 13418 / NBRC 101707 / SANAE) TaxID=304371 RepID=D1YZX9_METPS|nr:glycosyltransferase family 4 protein [Methanocella paludicola]BAI62001.1 putative glycosyltransferase [Methanocella paludicola SANAE]